MIMQAKKIIVNTEVHGKLEENHMSIEEEEIPELKDGEFLTEALYIGVDPDIQIYEVGQTLNGYQVAKISASKNEEFPVGNLVVGAFGWRTHTTVRSPCGDIYDVPDLDELPLSLALGAAGPPGNRAYFGLLDGCRTEPGETLVISGAAGATGSIVGQIAKMCGCTVVGLTDSQVKADWLRDLTFDHAINSADTTVTLEDAFEHAVPNGVDCYFDTWGGEHSEMVLKHMNEFGRIVVCGSIGPSGDVGTRSSLLQATIVKKQLTIKGFLVGQMRERWTEGIEQNLKWIKEGKLQYKEKIVHGFEHLPKALIDIFNGESMGTTIVEVKSRDAGSHSHNFKHLLRIFQQMGN